MNQLKTLVEKNPFMVAAGGYGLYSAVRCGWNLKRGQGCPKCEFTGLALGLSIAAWASFLLYQSYRG